MPDLTYTGFCGVDCSACSDLSSGSCSGCRQSAENGFDDCGAIKCCKEKNISCCGECPDFPCGDMKEFYAESDSHRKAYELMRKLREK